MFAFFLSTLARAADLPAVWDWSTPHRYRLTADEVMAPPIDVAVADNIMAEMGAYTVMLDITCATSNERAAGGGTTVACAVHDATLTGRSSHESDQAQLDESLRQLGSWLRGATMDFVQRDDGVIKRFGEVKGGPEAPRMSRTRTVWLNDALRGCLESLNVAIAPDAPEWRTPMPNGSLKLHVTGRTDDRLTFDGEHGEIARISGEFDRQLRAIARSRVYYATLGNTSSYYWSREFTSELLDPPAVALEP